MDRHISVLRKYLNALCVPGKMETDDIVTEDLPRHPRFHPVLAVSERASIRFSRASPSEFTCLAYFYYNVG